MPENAHFKSGESLLKELEVDAQKGLAETEVSVRLKKYGENKPPKSGKKSIWLVFLEQFLDPIIYILAAAMVLAFAFSDHLEGFAVLVVILITAFIGFGMEWQAIKSVEALQKMVQTQARVLRNSEVKKIPARLLVPGDILILEAGDVIPADARVLTSESFAVKEAVLTGESNQIEKKPDSLPESIPLAERKNMLYKATIAVRGRATALVVATAAATEIGRITALTQSATKESTPLEKKLNSLSRWLIWLTLGLTVLIVITGFFQGKDLSLMIKTGIALAVAAIPEGLPIVATIALARGMLRLSKQNVVIKKLEAVQTLGETGIICTDKTGTLTENKMSVEHLLFDSAEYEVDASEEEIKAEKSFNKLTEIAALCNNAEAGDDGYTGDAVEVALVEFLQNFGLDYEKIRSDFPKIAEVPFDAEIKKMATLNQYNDHFLVSSKGALEAVLPNCNQILTSEGEKEFTDKEFWLKKGEEIAGKGIRVLAFAYREYSEKPEKEELMENLVFVGLLGFIDPPRKDIKQAIETYKSAGIRVVMVTGDHPDTARKIGEEIGLLDENAPRERVMHGHELEEFQTLSEENKTQLMEAAIFARMVPKQKLDLVEFYQKNNAIVGMLGDGVNDAPALKKADIGIAMGIRGTEAAKEVADVILMDDKFTSTKVAIHQGRTIFENIRQFVIFLLSCNLAEIISVALASFSNLPLPLLPLQILFLNLVTDVFPALALGVGKGDPRVMKQPPRNPEEPILTRKLWTSTILYGVSITAGVLGIVVYAHLYQEYSALEVNNMAFYTLILAQLLNVFNLPSRKTSFIKNEVTKNSWVWAALAFSSSIMVVIYFIPVMREALSLVALSGSQFVMVGVFALVTMLISQILKRIGFTN